MFNIVQVIFHNALNILTTSPKNKYDSIIQTIKNCIIGCTSDSQKQDFLNLIDYLTAHSFNKANESKLFDTNGNVGRPITERGVLIYLQRFVNPKFGLNEAKAIMDICTDGVNAKPPCQYTDLAKRVFKETAIKGDLDRVGKIVDMLKGTVALDSAIELVSLSCENKPVDLVTDVIWYIKDMYEHSDGDDGKKHYFPILNSTWKNTKILKCNINEPETYIDDTVTLTIPDPIPGNQANTKTIDKKNTVSEILEYLANPFCRIKELSSKLSFTLNWYDSWDIFDAIASNTSLIKIDKLKIKTAFLKNLKLKVEKLEIARSDLKFQLEEVTDGDGKVIGYNYDLSATKNDMTQEQIKSFTFNDNIEKLRLEIVKSIIRNPDLKFDFKPGIKGTYTLTITKNNEGRHLSFGNNILTDPTSEKLLVDHLQSGVGVTATKLDCASPIHNIDILDGIAKSKTLTNIEPLHFEVTSDSQLKSLEAKVDALQKQRPKFGFELKPFEGAEGEKDTSKYVLYSKPMEIEIKTISGKSGI